MEEKKLLNKVLIFVFLFVKWTILMMALLPFWALNVSVALRSMQSQKALRLHWKYINLYYEDKGRSYGFGTNNEWQNFNVWVIYPFKTCSHKEQQLLLIQLSLYRGYCFGVNGTRTSQLTVLHQLFKCDGSPAPQLSWDIKYPRFVLLNLIWGILVLSAHSLLTISLSY